MSSGVGVDRDCVKIYQELKMEKRLKFIIFGLNNVNTEIVVLNTSDSPSYDDFINELPDKDCRWAVYDFHYQKDGGKRNKICFYSWSPDDAPIKSKMVYASSKDAIRRSLDGVQMEFQGTEYSEISHETVLDKLSRSATA